ncbi:MAG: hypothetical protein OXE40_00800, partial [Gammaproteobacteria bacterium]|nr:hypothetical protein [Gammaproteobacteria bacterium]
TARLRASNHTLKRTLTDQRIFAGIGNAYSDEILPAAGLSPFKRARDVVDEETERLYAACRRTLTDWIRILRTKAGDAFPDKVTAFRDEMAAHGKYRRPCPVCGAPIQRIVHAENESNYCARCQTGGRVLADRSLSRLLRDAWPKRIEELEGGWPAPTCFQGSRHSAYIAGRSPKRASTPSCSRPSFATTSGSRYDTKTPLP